MRIRLFCLLLLVVVSFGSQEEADAAFLNWFARIAPQSPTGVISTGPSRYGRGVIAVSDIREGDLAIRVPLEYVICKRTALKSNRASVYHALAQKDEASALAVLLMAESLDPASKWAPWFAVMPEAVNSPAWYTDEEMDLLRGDAQYVAIKRQAQQVRADYDTKVVPVLREKGGSAFPLVRFNWELYRWARSMLDSRAWTLHGARYLVPFADLFNFAPSAEQLRPGYVQPAMRGAAFINSHKVVGDAVEVYAERDCSAGEELFESYGDNTNDIYLKYHGFIPERNPIDCAPLRVAFDKSDPSFDTKVEVLKGMGLGRPPSICLKDVGERGTAGDVALTDDAVLFLTVVGLGKDDAALARRHVGKAAFRKALRAYAAASKGGALSAAAAHARAALRAYPTPLEADERKAKLKKTSDNAKVILQYLIVKKRTLSHAVAAIDAADLETAPPLGEFLKEQKRRRQARKAEKAVKSEL